MGAYNVGVTSLSRGLISPTRRSASAIGTPPTASTRAPTSAACPGAAARTYTPSANRYSLSGSERRPSRSSLSGLTLVCASPTMAASRIIPTTIWCRCSVGIRASSAATARAKSSRDTVW
jgi:hypothetical protein